MQVSRRLDSLYEEAQRRGTLSRTKLWNYAAYRDLEQELRQYSEIGAVTQIDAITKACDRVFQDVIGVDVEALQRKKYILPYSPRAVIDTAWSGESFSVRVWKNTEELARRIRDEAQQMVLGLKSSGTVKRQLMRDFDVSWKQASRLVDTELSYVLNKAELEDMRRDGFQKVEIICLKSNTCEKCQALAGEVFYLEDAPVLPIHPRCQCSYVQPRAFDKAEVTASGGNLEEVYARKGVKGYGDGAGSTESAGAVSTPDGAKLYAPRGMRPSEAAQGSGVIPAEALQGKVEKAVGEAAPGLSGNVPTAAVEMPTAAEIVQQAAAGVAEGLPEAAEGGIIEAGTWYERNIAGKPEMEARYLAAMARAKAAGKMPGVFSPPRIPEYFENYTFDDAHANGERHHEVTEEEAREYVRNAVLMENRGDGTFLNYYSYTGGTFLRMRKKEIRTAFKDFTPNVKKMLEVMRDEFGEEQT